MEIKKEILPKSHVKLNIKVSSPEMRGFFSRTYNKLAPSVEVKGFRKGMAPKSLTIAAIGENRFNSEIIDLSLQETYAEVLKKEKLLPVAQPKVEIKIVKDLMVDTAEMEYEVEMDILPEVKLGDYKKIKIDPPAGEKEIKVDKEEVEHVLSHLQRQKATFKDADRPAKKGDRMEINFEGFDRGVKIETLSSQNYPVILGSGVLLPDFENNLINLKTGDKKEFKVNIPENKEKQSKKEIDFKVEILSVQKVLLPELNDEFARDYQKKDIEDLKKAIREDILNQKKQGFEKAFEGKVLEELLKMIETDLPESLVEQEIERQISEIQTRVAAMGLTLEKYLESLKKNLEEFRKELRPQAEKTIKIGLALGKVVKQESANWQIDPKDKLAGKIALDKLSNYVKNNR